jgi:hypothetical protein
LIACINLLRLHRNKCVRNESHSDSELKDFEKKSRGILYCGPNLDQIVMRFEQLSDGDVCRLGGKWLDSYDKKRQHEQVSAKVLEVEAALCVQRDVGQDAHRHSN